MRLSWHARMFVLIVSQAEFSPSEHVSVFGRRQIGIGTDLALNRHNIFRQRVRK